MVQWKCDFRIIAEFFAAQRKGEQYRGTTRKIKHVDEMLKFMAVFTEDHRFLEVKLDEKDKEEANMCAILDQIENKGIETGKNYGIQSVSKLIGILIQQGKTGELEMLRDQNYCEELLNKYHLL